MIHYTLNTGEVVHSARLDVGDDAIEACRKLAARCGGVIPGCSPFRVTVIGGIGSAIFTIRRRQEPLVACGLAWTEAGELTAWPAIESVYLSLSDKYPQIMAPANHAEKPDALPWLAVVWMPSLPNQRHDDIAWLGKFERCMAWTIVPDDCGSR